MTPELLAQWAREAGAEVNRISTIFYSRADLEAFAAKVAAHEREMCAKACENWEYGETCADKIRARGSAETKKVSRPLGCGAVTFGGQGGGIRCGEMGYFNQIFLCGNCGGA